MSVSNGRCEAIQSADLLCAEYDAVGGGLLLEGAPPAGGAVSEPLDRGDL
jgi:hypothetical protein